ncbi:MAG: hypothetical protein M2R45_02541 [Verrucomicrobia subdivision 3 bacterium]|nr:hypothetical protein [Limisphaerales bacterium]MCS1414251.1 hypothetical protein [Limisphaerales bacterium]
MSATKHKSGSGLCCWAKHWIRCKLSISSEDSKTLRTLPGFKDAALNLSTGGMMRVNCLYASLFGPPLQTLQAVDLPADHRNSPDYLNILRYRKCSLVASKKNSVELLEPTQAVYEYAAKAHRQFQWPTKLRIKEVKSTSPLTAKKAQPPDLRLAEFDSEANIHLRRPFLSSVISLFSV